MRFARGKPGSIEIEAWNRATDQELLGLASSITLSLTIGDADYPDTPVTPYVNPTTGTDNPTEIGGGAYRFDFAPGDTDHYVMQYVVAVAGTTNVSRPVGKIIYPDPENIERLFGSEEAARKFSRGSRAGGGEGVVTDAHGAPTATQVDVVFDFQQYPIPNFFSQGWQQQLIFWDRGVSPDELKGRITGYQQFAGPPVVGRFTLEEMPRAPVAGERVIVY